MKVSISKVTVDMELNLNKKMILLLLVLIESQQMVAEPVCEFNCPYGINLNSH